jgi:hypothetical protein
MKRLLLASVCFALTSPVFAQSSTAVGTGVGISSSRSASQATAIGGGAAQGGAATSAVTINSAATPAVQTINNTGTQTLRNVPTVFAPGLTSAGLETCLGSFSAGAGVVGTGATFGSTVPDEDCTIRLYARTQWSFGQKAAAIAMLCQSPRVWRSEPDVCAKYTPQQYQVQVQPTAYPGPGPIFGTPVWNSNASAEVPSQEPEPYRGGPILLVEGKTGKERLCNDWNEAQKSCRVWAYSHHPEPSKKKAAPNVGSKPRTTAQSSAGGSPLPAEVIEGKSQ